MFARVLKLVAEVAAAPNTRAKTRTTGRFGTLPSEYATPLALALTELVTNAVEHGLAGQVGEVEVVADRSEQLLTVQVRDTGSGLPEGRVGEGLGTQIVRTLIQGELGGTIDWHTVVGTGTEVTIEVPHVSDPYPMQERAFFNPGSVGQPRDRDPRAAYALFDPDARTWEPHRVEYDVHTVQQQILEAGLPPRHADRLSGGW